MGKAAKFLLLLAGRLGGLLDQYSGAAAAYSLRSLSTSTTNVVKVRRSGDDAELDFTASEVSDGTLAAWVVAGGGTEDGFVTTWYDQSGNTNNATQATAASQPKIVSSGSLVTDNGKAALDFDGTNDSLAFTQITSVSGMYLTAVANFDTITGGVYEYQFVTIISDENGGFVQDIGIGARQNKASLYYEFSSTENEILSSTISINTQYLLTGFSDSNGSFIAVNGTQTTGVAGRDDYIVQTIGGEGTFSIPQMDGTIQEVIVYTSDQSANRTGIEANINDYYNIYP